jgi:predicted phosphoribosyltransferase
MELIVMMFKDRVEAGRRLAKLLKRYAVDDGVATGYTIKAAVKEIRSKNPKRLVVAVPVIPSDTARDLDRMVDDLQCIAREYFFLGAVGAYYDNFPQIQDEEVIELLQASNKQKV